MVVEQREKRRFPRVGSENALLVRKLGTEGVEGFAKTKVVGLGGCMFLSDEPVGIGSGLEILMSVRGRIAKALGRVVYELPGEGAEVQVGVEFLGISGPDREVLQSLFQGRAASA